MTIATRKRLDRALEDRVLTLLLITDEDLDVAETVHDVAEEIAKPGQEVFLIKDMGLLTPAERKLWFDESGHYAVVGGKQRVVAIRGPLDELILSDGSPSKIEIRYVLAKGDVLP